MTWAPLGSSTQMNLCHPWQHRYMSVAPWLRHVFLWHVLEFQSCLPFLLAPLALALEQYLLSSNACQWQLFSLALFCSLVLFFLQVHGFFAVAAVPLLSSTIFHAPHTPMELVSLHHHSLCLFFCHHQGAQGFFTLCSCACCEQSHAER